MSIKQSLGKLTIDPSYLDTLRRQGFVEPPVAWRHAEEVGRLPPIHRDPFDRVLIAQTRVERMVLATADETIRKYDVQTI